MNALESTNTIRDEIDRRSPESNEMNIWLL